MNNKQIIKYCTGCGACVSAGVASMSEDKNGFKVANPLNEKFNKYCNKVCFSSGTQYANTNTNTIWGYVRSSFHSWSNNEFIRTKGSSGGTLTSICIYLLECGVVDGIVHTEADPKSPILTITTCSTSRQEIINHSGSRYSSSSPLVDIYSFLNSGKKYCYVGKPCDIATMRNLAKLDKSFSKTFPILLSFFCAGAPSTNANINLLKKMGTNMKECVSLRYRGDGWPGFATAIDKKGKIYKLPYRNAWRDTLGRDIRPVCRFCIDGIGDMADIVCYDAWYMDQYRNPLFEEAEGRNGVICRTELGEKIFCEAIKKGYVTATNYSDFINDLPYIQAYQYTRRATMSSTLLTMKILLKSTPNYPYSILISLMKYETIRNHIIRIKGTFKRIIQGKIK